MIPSDLLASLSCNPFEDGPRLQLAQWYDQQGDPRAKVLKLQIEQTRLKKSTSMNRSPSEINRLGAIDTTLKELLAEYAAGWCEEWGVKSSEIVGWERGLPTVRLTWERLFEASTRLFSNTPILSLIIEVPERAMSDEEEYDEDEDEDEDEDDNENTKGGVVTADDGSIPSKGDERVERLASLDLSQLTSLSLAYTATGPKGAKALAKSESLRNLKTLDLRYGGVGDAGIGAIAKSTNLSGIEALYLQRNDIGPKGAQALADSTTLQYLSVLDLRYNAIEARGAKALASSPIVERLTSLRLFRDDIGASGCKALASSTRLSQHIRSFWKAQ